MDFEELAASIRHEFCADLHGYGHDPYPWNPCESVATKNQAAKLAARWKLDLVELTP